jgi:CheY-like chemotaxis protein
MAIVLLSNDLMVGSRVEGAALRAGAPFQSAGSEDDALRRCAERKTKLLLVDLASLSLSIEKLVDRARSMGTEQPAVIAFGPHVHKERLDAARQAGCDEVLSRGQFFAQLDAIVARASVGEANHGTAGGG